jgi:hypothetical protein
LVLRKTERLGELERLSSVGTRREELYNIVRSAHCGSVYPIRKPDGDFPTQRDPSKERRGGLKDGQLNNAAN